MDHIDWLPDKANSISSSTGRLVVDGARSVEVHPDASSKAQIAALLDLLDLHLSGAATSEDIRPDRVIIRIPEPSSEARGAIGTLIDALVTPLTIDVLELTRDSAWSPAAIGWDLSEVSEYRRWPGLLSRSRPVPPLVSAIVRDAAIPALRAYPMLSTEAGWSLRLEGLEVGRVTADQVALGVGKDGKSGAQSRQRAAWVDSTGNAMPLITSDASEAVREIAKFATSWQNPGTTKLEQDEHALESRILRGETPIQINGRLLSLIESDPVVNWGSQFPTKWGPGGKARYLDALLRDGSIPWAVEMKVEGGAGVGQYYRHAVAQAVLYREFIRQAHPLHEWFEDRGLDAAQCRAAVVVPQMTNPKQARWRDHVVRLCEAFAVEFIEVDPKHALRH
ncbi:hypothetical protein [Aeromicrobium sp. CF3.5]|uniref:hypothetical protein n=1 Tax=Aeromicrobium sp. CF3.5 TaxID=3373078 RepID=UPI003EE81864